MDKLLIRGGRRLNGQVPIAGAKNAALPELCAALLVDQPVLLHNVPQLQDVSTMLRLLRSMGVVAEMPFAAGYRVELRLNDSSPHVLQQGNGARSPVLRFQFVDSAVTLIAKEFFGDRL